MVLEVVFHNGVNERVDVGEALLHLRTERQQRIRFHQLSKQRSECDHPQEQRGTVQSPFCHHYLHCANNRC